MNISPQTLEALVQVISGGASSATGKRQHSIGIYRTATQIESFVRMCGVTCPPRSEPPVM